MKKYLFIFILMVAILPTFAQDSLYLKKKHNNELGLDVTGFIRQFVSSNQQFPDYYFPTYYLTYRRHFNFGSIRFAVGGDFSKEEIAPGFEVDSNEYFSSSSSYDFRIGWEFQSNLSKRWQAFYGVDFRPSFSHDKNDAPYWNGGYANGRETKYEVYAIAPLLGIRFRPTNRISLTTEASFSIIWENRYDRKYFIPVTNQYPEKPDDVSPNNKKFYSSFSQPISIILTFDL